MRKILISVLVGLMILGTCFFVVNGLVKLNIQGAKGISKKDNEVNEKVSELSNVVGVTYPNATSTLKQASNKLIDSKTEYENQAVLSNTKSSSYASKLEKTT